MAEETAVRQAKSQAALRATGYYKAELLDLLLFIIPWHFSNMRFYFSLIFATLASQRLVRAAVMAS